MNIAEIPRQVPRKHRQQLKMLGLNATNDYADGELEDCIGVSTEAYPYITVADAPGLTTLEGTVYTDADGNESIFSDSTLDVKTVYGFRDKLFVVGTVPGTIKTQAWYGKPASESEQPYFRRCDRGEDGYGNYYELNNTFPKQIVSINNKLCVFPDCLYLDCDSTRTHLQRFGRRLLWGCDGKVVIFKNDTASTCSIKFPASLSIDFRDLFRDKLKVPPDSEFHETLLVDRTDGDWFVRVFGAKEEEIGAFSVTKVGKREMWFEGRWHGIETGQEWRTTRTGENRRNVQICEAYDTDGGDVADPNAPDELPIIPALDYVCSHDNRLYGCSSRDQTIYVSALGDPSDWFSFENDLKAYAVAVGSDGNFTGCCASNGYVIFTKQHCIHKLMGSVPSEYYLHTLDTEGAAEGMGLSMCNCSGTIVYVGEQGLYTYNGGYTGRLSKALDPKGIKNPCCCFDGKRYLLGCNYFSQNKHLFDFDLEHGVCVMRDTGQYDSIAHVKDLTYAAVDGTLKTLKSEVPHDGLWYMTYKPFIDTISGTYHSETEIFEKKRYFKVYMRCIVPEGSFIRLYFDFLDVNGIPIPNKQVDCGFLYGPFRGVKTFVFMTNRFDDIQMVVSGSGYSTICSIQREYQQKESSR